MSSNEIDILHYFLPTGVLVYIFSNFLTISELSQFDIAITNYSKRSLYLELIGSKECYGLGIRKKILMIWERNS